MNLPRTGRDWGWACCGFAQKQMSKMCLVDWILPLPLALSATILGTHDGWASL